MDAKKFGAFISERRKEQHMTQAGLAGKIGVTDKAVSRWERGLGFPDINTMEPLATALGVSLLELMKSEIISEEVQMKKDESAEKKYTSAEVTEMMYSMEEIRKQQQRQDKIAGYLAIPVMLIVAAIFKLSGHANFGGAHCHWGDHIYANFNLTMVDDTHIYVGDYTMFGPNVTIATAGHPILPELREKAYQYNAPVHIGKNCWLGAGVIVLPGITIGDNVVIGAGSIVTKDLPPNVVAVGNPCRILRKINEHDKEYYFKSRKIDLANL